MKNPLHVLTTMAALAVTTAPLTAAPAPEIALLRGRYLVERVIGCADCHSPRDQTGQFVTDQWLGGATLPFAPTVPMPAWAPHAPAIAGLPTLSDRDAVHLLMNGRKPDGTMPRPPMPAFRLTEDDARAVVSYLRSLPAPKAAAAAAQ